MGEAAEQLEVKTSEKPKLVKTNMSKKFTKEALLKSYSLMTLLRRFEERAANLYQQGEIRGFCHLYIGQEAVLAGCKAASKEGDDNEPF